MIIRLCARPGCGTSLDHRRAKAVWCSDACRMAARRGRAVETTACLACGGLMHGRRSDARFCSPACSVGARRAGGSPNDAAYRRVLLADPCSYCDQPATTIDHIVATSRRGLNQWQNLTGACVRCNTTKRDRPLLSFLLARVTA